MVCDSNSLAAGYTAWDESGAGDERSRLLLHVFVFVAALGTVLGGVGMADVVDAAEAGVDIGAY